MLFKQFRRQTFTRERTVLVENTPQQCVHNYSNAIYVPTYEDGVDEEGGAVMKALGKFLLKINDEIEDVRKMKKCECPLAANGEFHECRSQSWWPK